MVKLMENILSGSLLLEYRLMGFRLWQQDDHILTLEYRNKPIADFSVEGATIVSINEACKVYLEATQEQE